ncbi:MAG: hypothetical protein M1828_003406 [Chrysothrix sp. TS-e1954]|nr:MAG: hypothetical protein M1828_003406 [Chrysothrix sp. TS-e1954]
MTLSDTSPAEGDVNYPSLGSKELRMSYRIARGEQGVLTFEPYKSTLLPLWRFRTPEVARQSAAELEAKFREYEEAGDFVGMDMARKFLQMGMTRAGRYANHKGGRKYEAERDDHGRKVEKSRPSKDADWRGRSEKREASNIFRGVWEDCKERQKYLDGKKAFLTEQKTWDAQKKDA